MRRAAAGFTVVAMMLLATQAVAVVEFGIWANYLDTFSSGTYSGSDGTIVWDTSWRETGEADGPSSGAIQVRADAECPEGRCLVMAGVGGETLVQLGATRLVDLSMFHDVDLSYDVRRVHKEENAGEVGSVLYVQISNDGKTWKTLKNLNVNGTDDAPLHVSHGIDNWIAEKVVVRFVAEGSLAGMVLIDNVELKGTAAIQGTTTTITSTTSTSTTTTTPSTTTTMESTTTTVLTTTTTVPDRDDDTSIVVADGPPPDSGIRDSTRGIQADYDPSLFGSDMMEPQVLSFEVSSDYLIASEAIESSWTWMAGLGAIIAWAIVSNMDRRRRLEPD